MTSTYWPDAIQTIKLFDITYQGQDLGRVTIDPVIQCDIQPNGVRVPPLKIIGLGIPYGTAANLDKIVYPQGPGGYAGDGAPEGILHLNVQVDGKPQKLAGATDAYFSLPPVLPGPPIDKTIYVLVIAHPVPPSGSGAELWFRFWVTSAC
jgi:hypothetical protein